MVDASRSARRLGWLECIGVTCAALAGAPIPEALLTNRPPEEDDWDRALRDLSEGRTKHNGSGAGN